MPTRTKGEKERAQKRVRTEKLLMILLAVFALSVFIILSFVFKDKTEPNAPDDADVCLNSANAISSRYNGGIIQSGKAYIVSFASPSDGKNVSIRVYLKNSVESMEIVREIAAPQPAPTSMFVGDEENAAPTEDAMFGSISSEITDYLAYIEGFGDTTELNSKLSDALDSLDASKTSKRTLLFGAYLITVGFSPSDMLLTVTCEPI